ncbi:plasma kallikrein isoform X2 [Chanos chanos]|uniref:Plasma kallikrein isoform X2 n=1 Tax=Chanos chanos TaxID=29144 RepID=A0A6J2WIE7_CHACN|nr:plasma kallikrein-like isoform X2 [Chanos chanos]
MTARFRLSEKKKNCHTALLTETRGKFHCYLKQSKFGVPTKVTEKKGVTSGFSLSQLERTPDICLSSLYFWVDFTGADFSSLFTQDYKECQRVCTNDPYCQFFSFLTEQFSKPEMRNKCFLKYSWNVPILPKIEISSEVTSRFSSRYANKTGAFDDDAWNSDLGILEHTDFPGNDFEQVPAVSKEHCMFLCSSHPRCTYFSYATSKYETSDAWYYMRCFLKHNVDERPCVPKKELFSGMPRRLFKPTDKPQPSSWVTEEWSYNIPGADSKIIPDVSDERCKRLCTEDSDCQFFSYYGYPRDTCFLKQVITLPLPPKVVLMDAVVSGFSLKGCDTPKPTEST